MRLSVVCSFLLITITLLLVVASCSSTKYVPKGEFWLENATVISDNPHLSPLDMNTYIQQKSNFKTFALFRLPLFIYNLSGRDTSKIINRFLKSGGEAPIIYDSTMVEKTVDFLEKAAVNKGFVSASVVPEIKFNKNKVKVQYKLISGERYVISDYAITVPDSVFQNKSIFSNPSFNRRRMQADTTLAFNLNTALERNTLVKRNSNFDMGMLDEERNRVASIFRRLGYFEFNKEHIGFIADTTFIKDNKLGLKATVYPYIERQESGNVIETKHRQFVIKSVDFYVDYNPLEDADIKSYMASHTIYKLNGNYQIHYGKRGDYIKSNIILSNCYIIPGNIYDENATTLTYNSLSQLNILRNVNIRYEEFIENDSIKLKCIISCVPDKRQGVGFEVEGTNSGGFLGVGASVGYQHRNLFKGSESFNVKLQGAYEALSTRFSDIDKNYFEVGGETSITFPRFMFPFLDRDLRRRLKASTQVSANYTYQRRPDYFTRTILASSFTYLWQNQRNSSTKHALDLINVSYVHIPNLNDSFRINKLTDAAREFSFKDQFVLGSGYKFTKTNFNPSNIKRDRQTSLYSFRVNVETAGNLLSLITAITDAKKDSVGSKKVFGTRFVQYVLGNMDYSKSIPIDEKNSLAWRIGAGLVYPYGNYRMVPIQKRFFSGGANSVRGWNIRELGPGSFYKPGSTFYDQSGEIRFDANLEYRSRIFWKFELAAFLDAGNIWTIKKYEQQEKGNFSLKTFHKEIAAAWGLGFRIDFDYVLIRLDGGWKIYDPADVARAYIKDSDGNAIPDPNAGYKSKWPVAKPLNLKRNTAWHIAIGYPF